MGLVRMGLTKGVRESIRGILTAPAQMLAVYEGFCEGEECGYKIRG